MFSEWLWRYWRCPTTLQAAALDFVRNRPGLVHAFANPELWTENSVLSWKRQIGGRYGLRGEVVPDPLYGFKSPWPADWTDRLSAKKKLAEVTLPDGTWMPGWNRPLLAEAGPDPQMAAERILQRVLAVARSESDDRYGQRERK